MKASVPVRIGYSEGQAKRVNERAIDSRWTRYLGEYNETVPIPPLAFMRLFGGSFGQWHDHFPGSLAATADSLDQLCRKYGVSMLYINVPALVPYLLMARNYGKLDVGMLMIAHSVATPFWLRQWIGIAPWIAGRDVLLSSTESCTAALCNVSPRYAEAMELPLCIELHSCASGANRQEGHLLAIGRIERVKNIDVLIECFSDIRRHVPHARLTIAGEYTGADAEQIVSYERQIAELVQTLGLTHCIRFTGAVEGEAKERVFREADVLLNLSTEPGETFGYNLIEAKTWGIPVVCTNWDGFRTVVNHGEDGLLADCDWSGGIPVIDRAQVVEHTVRLLTDRTWRERMGRRAGERACEYDYRTIMPRLAAGLALCSDKAKLTGATGAAQAPAYPIVGPEEVTRHASIPLRELTALYRSDRLAGTGLLDETALSVLAERPEPDYEIWMSRVKPIIHHFAGRGAFAKLSPV